jgi:hypothetical protein
MSLNLRLTGSLLVLQRFDDCLEGFRLPSIDQFSWWIGIAGENPGFRRGVLGR